MITMLKLRFYYLMFISMASLIIWSCEENEGFSASGDLSPVIAIGSPSGTAVTFSSDRSFDFSILFTDDSGLASFSLISADLGVEINESLSGETIYQYEETIDISSDFGSFPLVVTVTDNAGNSSTQTITFTKEEVIGNFVYAVGGATWNMWDPSKGMQMEEDEDNPGWYELTLYSDGTPANGEVKFIGQLDWSPNNWGPESNTEVSATGESAGSTVNTDASGTLILPAGYSVVRFNPELGQYRVTPIQDALPTPNGQFFIMGCGFQDIDGNDIDLCWSADNAYPMVQDAVNPYLHRLTVRFTESVDLKFNGNQAWDALDWGFPDALGEDGKTAPDGDVLFTVTGNQYGADWKFFDRQGTYELVVDEYTQYSQIRKIN